MRKMITLAAMSCALLASACNTVEGVGRDVASAGDTVANAANDHK
ncbi:entericidin A/B family lipoprotein [Sphingomonas sp. LB-2]|nr:entericidin A/B family lipoprotein [Sphingomonas caeni]MCW3847568.1 entericidin A/B family lipoprotein [Sphingomonas caeni]